MYNFKLLYGLSFKNYFAKPTNKTSNSYRVVSYAVLGVLSAILIAGACVFLYFMSKPMAAYKGTEYFIATVLFASQVIVLFQGLAAALSVLFYSKDNEFLRMLPIKTHEVFIARFSMIYTTNLVVSTIFLLPMLLTIGIASNIGFQYYLMLPLTLVFTPMIPLLIISILSLPIMAVVKFFKRSSYLSVALMLIGYLAFMAVYFIVIFAFNAGGDFTGDENAVDALFNMMIGGFKISSYIIYPNLFIARAMTNVNVAMNLPVYLVIMLASGAIAVGLAAAFYNKIIAYTLQNVDIKHKAKERKKNTSVVRALVKNDFMNVSRQSGLMFNSIFGLFFIPMLVAIIGSFSMGESSNILSVMLFPILGCAMNYFAIVGVSRDRDKFFINKYLPITAKQYVNAKLSIANGYSVLMAFVLMIEFFAMGYNAIQVILTVFVVLFFGTGISAYCIGADLKKPNFKWNNMKELLKNNTKSVAPILAAFVIGILLNVAGAFVAQSDNKGMIDIILIIMVILSALFTAGTHYNLFKKTDKLYNAIEATNG